MTICWCKAFSTDIRSILCPAWGLYGAIDFLRGPLLSRRVSDYFRLRGEVVRDFHLARSAPCSRQSIRVMWGHQMLLDRLDRHLLHAVYPRRTHFAVKVIGLLLLCVGFLFQAATSG